MPRISQRLNFLRLGALTEIDKVIAELGVDPEPLLAEHGLSSDMLKDGDRLVTAVDAGQADDELS